MDALLEALGEDTKHTRRLARLLADEWDEYGQGYARELGLVVCVCGAATITVASRESHVCPYDNHLDAELDAGS